MDYNTPAIRKDLIAAFPKLSVDPNFYVESPFTFQYNCIAWAMGMVDRWVDVASIPWHWWPEGVLKDESEDSLKLAFEALGFEECKGKDVHDGYDVVALYSKNGKWQHAARVLDSNVLHSKFGAYNDARHSAGNVLDNCYGTIYQYMRRPVEARSVTDKIKGDNAGEIHANKPVPGTDIYLVFLGSRIFDEQGVEYVLNEGKLNKV